MAQSKNDAGKPKSVIKLFVIIHGDSIIGPFGSYAAAVNAGHAQIGDDSFLVKRLEPPRPAG